MIDGFSMPDRLDKNGHTGEIFEYCRNNIIAKLLKLENLLSHIRAIFVEMYIKSKQCSVCCCTYNPNKSLIGNHI